MSQSALIEKARRGERIKYYSACHGACPWCKLDEAQRASIERGDKLVESASKIVDLRNERDEALRRLGAICQYCEDETRDEEGRVWLPADVIWNFLKGYAQHDKPDSARD